MGNSRRKNLEKKCLNIARKIGQALSYIDTTEGERGGGWQRAKKAGPEGSVSAWREWVEEEEDREEDSTRETVKRMNKTMAAIAVKVGCAGPAEQKEAEVVKRERVEERKKEDKKRRENRGMNQARKELGKQEEEEIKEKEEKKKAVAAEEARLAELKMLEEKQESLAGELARGNKGVGEELTNVRKRIQEVKDRRIVHEGKTFRATTGTPEAKWRRVVIITKFTEKATGKEAMIQRIREKTNDLLKEVRGTDGQPIGHIGEVKIGGVWGDPSEVRWLMEGVHMGEKKSVITRVVYEQMEIICQQEGMGLARVFVNELRPAVVIIKGVAWGRGQSY